MGFTAMVPNAVGNGNPGTDFVTKRRNSTEEPQGECHPLLLNASLRLGAWLVSGKARQQRIFQQQLPYSSLEPGQRELDQVTTRV